MRCSNQTYSGSYAAIFPTTPPLPRSSPTKKTSGSIGNTTLHSLPGLYLLAISNAPSMLSASNATLYLAALLLTSIAIFIILFFFRIDPLRRSVGLGVNQAPLPDGYLFVGHVAISRAGHRANFRETRLAEVRRIRLPAYSRPRIFMHHHNM